MLPFDLAMFLLPAILLTAPPDGGDAKWKDLRSGRDAGAAP